MTTKCNLALLDIVLDSNKSQFQAGDNVSGVIRFELKGSAIVANKISLICDSEVKWTEDSVTPYYGGGYVYYNKKRLVNFGYSLPKKYESLSEGKHEIPFEFQLPEKDIPSTFVGSNGSIKYFVEVVNEDPDKEEVERVGLLEFKVDAPLRENLNLSIGCSKEKDLGIFSLGSGKISLYASLSKKGWSKGELLELHCTVDNKSTVEVCPRASLYQTQVYMCGERHKALEIGLTEAVVGKKIQKNTNFTETLFIPIPEDVSLTIKSSMISVKYFIHVTLDIPHAFDIHVNIPLVITTKSLLSADK